MYSIRGNNLARREPFFRIAAWLALLSIAMLFVAPLISKSLAHHETCQHEMFSMIMSGMQHDMPMAEHCHGDAGMNQRMLSGHGMSPVEEIACGYCQLLIHLPFDLLILAVLILLILLLFCSPLPQQPPFFPLFRAWTPQRARAPPAVFIFAIN